MNGLSNMRDEIRIHSGEVFEQVYLNAPGLDLHIVQEAGSRVRLHVINIYGEGLSAYTDPVSHEICLEQVGEGCSTEIYSMAFLRGEEQVSLHTHITHAVGGGVSKQVAKYVLDEQARGAFWGELCIAKDAQQTETEQVNKNLLLSADAHMRTRPQLEIYADDVKASHGATTGQLDETALFYMQQRGLSEATARQMLVAAFVKDVVETITDTALRDRLVDAIDRVVEQ